MCGIAGEVRFDRTESKLAVTRAMCDAELHRGPDDDGYYSKGPVSLGIRRLSIIDLKKGLYPITNEKGTIQLVFNGEIYGFDRLRSELEGKGHRFRTETDAETLVHGYEEWGTDLLSHINGMFAIALWDESKKLLWLARDNFGIKPLYYYRSEGFFAFASEIKPIIGHPDVTVQPNDRIIRDYIERSQVDHTEDTFFGGVKQLRPGHYMLISPNGTVEMERYWAPKISRQLTERASEDEAEKTRKLFLDAVTEQLVSDVPVGTCLSGGIDSSSVVCSIKKVKPEGTISTGKSIRTFSAIFPGYQIDESRYAKMVCDATQAEYNPVQPSAEELWRDLPQLIRCQEEPFASTSIYAQFRVMRRAKERGMTVLLDGQGSDELLCGYVPLYLHYLITLRNHRKYWKLLTEGIRSFDLTRPLVLGNLRSYLRRAQSLLAPSRRRRTKARAGARNPIQRSEGDLQSVLEVLTSIHGLPALLRYEDKNSMWHSIEARVPFLHRPFFEYVASLPLDKKLHDGWTKYIFRRAMTAILPEEIRLRRSKIGFETPEKRWIEKDLRNQFKEFFAKSVLIASEYYDLTEIRNLLEKPTLKMQQTSLIWRAFNLEMWYREFFGKESPVDQAVAPTAPQSLVH